MVPLRILHLGLGAFHRAHQAVVMQRLLDVGEQGWALASADIRPGQEALLAALHAQGGAYTLETAAPDGTRRHERIAAIGQVVPFEPELAAVVKLGADPATRIVSFTVTEAGYDIDDSVSGQPQNILFAALAAILRQRRMQGAGPLTLLSCDNLRHNGDRSRAGLLQYLALRGDACLHQWVRSNTSCPNAMVDRITPRPAPGLRARLQAETGRDDAAPLMAESYLQWVIEDRFCNGRPPWEAVGVQMVAEVAPFEEAKIRILNASHSGIAWAGTLLGHRFIHEAVADPRIRPLARAWLHDDIIPSLEPSPIDLPAYADTVLQRFGNAALADTCQRVVADGYAKLPGFIAPSLQQRLARDESIASVAMLPALFLAFLQRWHAGALAEPYSDQAMDAAAAHALCAAADPVAAFAADVALWGPLAGDARLLAALRSAARRVAALLAEAGR
jgi:D-arabinitol 4-dehydrogenase